MREESIRAKKSLGQNFLIDHEALSDIASAIDISGKHIIEVGPGYGALTDYLIESSPASLDLVELDDDMIPILSEKFEGSITLHHQDVLTFVSQHETYSVLANIPYYITSPILFHFLYDIPHPPEEMVIMMQREVGEKILALGKKRHYSLLSLAMYEACESIEAVRLVPRTSFRPAPKVDSIVLTFHTRKSRNSETESALIQLWKQAFAHPRKTLLSNLKGFYDTEKLLEVITSLGYDARVRAEAIEREDWKKFL